MSRAREKQTARGSIYWSLTKLGVPTDKGNGRLLLTWLAEDRYPSYLLNVIGAVLAEAVEKNVEKVKQKVKAAVE